MGHHYKAWFRIFAGKDLFNRPVSLTSIAIERKIVIPCTKLSMNRSASFDSITVDSFFDSQNNLLECFTAFFKRLGSSSPSNSTLHWTNNEGVLTIYILTQQVVHLLDIQHIASSLILVDKWNQIESVENQSVRVIQPMRYRQFVLKDYIFHEE